MKKSMILGIALSLVCFGMAWQSGAAGVQSLRGDMSVVGPRPPIPYEVERYTEWHKRRLEVLPGITGLWQVRARHETLFDKWVEDDLEYIDRWSLWLDLQILVRTIPAALEGR